MYLISPTTLFLALLLASPALYRAFVTGDLDVTGALVRFLIAVPVAVVMLALLRAFTASYRDKAKGIAAQPVPRPEALKGEIESK